MRPGRVLLIFTLAVFVGGALLAPWLYWLTQWGASHWAGLEKLAHSPFHRYVNRCLLVLALAGIWPLMRALGMCSWKNLGWVGPSKLRRLRVFATIWRLLKILRLDLRKILAWAKSDSLAKRMVARPALGIALVTARVVAWATSRRLGVRCAAGFAFGFVSLAVVGLVALGCGAWEIHADIGISRLLKKLLGAALSAVVVAMLEETFFRGAVMGALRRVHSVTVAIILSSAIYALLHFFQRPEPPGDVQWFTGLTLLPQMMRGFVDWPTLVPSFFNLTLAGIILALAYQRTGNLYFSMGLHGGWIFWMKFWSVIAGVRSGADTWTWGSPGKPIEGWLTLAVLVTVLFVVVSVLRRSGLAEVTRDGQGQVDSVA